MTMDLSPEVGAYLLAFSTQISRLFSEDDLRGLCLMLGIGYENLPAQGHMNKARELVMRLWREQRLPALATVVRQQRPGATWPEPPAAVKLTFLTPLDRLQAMPTDETLAPGLLPPGSRIEFTPNPLFVGREQELRQLAQRFKAEGTVTGGQTVAITGIGGKGKTQLASEFAHRYGPYFAGGVFWVSFAQAENIATEVAACGQGDENALAAGFASFSLAEQVQWVQNGWQTVVPRLLIFDNCEDERLLQRWRPKTGGCRVLLTSRRGRWDKSLGVHQISLSILDRVDSVALLRRFVPDIETEVATAVAAACGGLPLALHLAGKYLEANEWTISPRDYLAQLQAESLRVLVPLLEEESDTSPTEHDPNVARTFTLSYAQLHPVAERDRQALLILARAAHLAPGEPIPPDLLGAIAAGTDEVPAEQISAALNRLVDLGFLEKEQGRTVVLHRLLALYVRAETEDIAAAQAGAEAGMLAAIDKRTDVTGRIGPAPLLISHLRYVTEAAFPRDEEQTARLCTWLGHYLDEIAEYQASYPYRERALTIWEKVLGGEHPNTASSLNNLGSLLQDMGDYAGARLYLERALAIREKVLGSEHPTTALSLNNLGNLLQDMGDNTGARPYYERALAIYEKVLGGEHPDTARSLNNLGSLLQAMGDHAGARPYLERALTIYEKVLGDEHPDTAVSLNNLGFLLRAMGDNAGARPYLKRALVIVEKALGGEHPTTALSLNNLGVLLRAMGDNVGALPYHERALTICEKVLGNEHPTTALSLNNLGSLLQDMGDNVRARLYYEQALAIREKVLGGEHPDTAGSLNNLGSLLQAMGDDAGARPYYERALVIYEKVLGGEHPDTAISLNNLGSLLQDMGDHAGARPYLEQALAIVEDKLGPDHPHTQIVRNNLNSL